MSDDRLLRSKGGDALERELLKAGAEERPSDEARKRTLAALGITGIGAAAGGATGAAATPAGRSGLARIVRWTGLAVTVAIGVGLGWLALGPASTPTTRSEPAVSSVAPATPATTVEATTVSPPAPPVESSAPSAPPAPSASVPRRAAAPTASDDTGLAAEVAALDKARDALGAGDAPRALRALDDYQRAFPRGILGQEALVVRIEALVKSGNTGAARALADRFLQANPRSPHAARIRHMVGEQDPP